MRGLPASAILFEKLRSCNGPKMVGGKWENERHVQQREVLSTCCPMLWVGPDLIFKFYN
jgi:hypothetical protein